MYLNEDWSAELCPLNRGNPLNRDPLNRGFTVYILPTVSIPLTHFLKLRSWERGFSKSTHHPKDPVSKQKSKRKFFDAAELCQKTF